MYKSKSDENISRTMQDKKKSETYSNYKDFRGDMQKATIDDSTFTADSTKFKSGINPKYKLDMDESYDYNKIKNPKAVEFVDRIYPEMGDVEQKRSGIYQDRKAGKLPQGRVAQHYQDMDSKMAQDKAKQMDTIPLSGKGYVGRDLASGANEIIKAGNNIATKLAKKGIPRIDISKSGKFGRDIKSSVNELIDVGNKGLKYVFGK